MNIDEMKESKYLRKEDFPRPALVTIKHLEKVNIAQKEKPPEYKWAMFFEEFEKGMVCNPTNRALVANALGTKETNEWIGRKIVVYHDPNVMFGTEVKGGLRLRGVRLQTPVAPVAPAKRHVADDAFSDQDDDIPFN